MKSPRKIKANEKNTEWLSDRCKSICERYHLVEFLGKVAAGENIDTRKKVLKDGREIEYMAPAHLADRLEALKMLMDRGWGKPAQTVAMSGTVEVGLTEADRLMVRDFLGEVGTRG